MIRLKGIFYILIAFIGRFPTSMNIIGVLTLVTITTNSVANAALVSATQAIATGISNPVMGRLTDRYGQRIPLLLVTPFGVLSILALLFATNNNYPLPILAFIGALIGATTMPIGALARVRWYASTKNPLQLSAALSWESTADELSFVLGPACVGLLAAFITPTAPLICSILIIITCVFPFALLDKKQPQKPEKQHTNRVRLFPLLRIILLPLAGMGTLGLTFGAMQTTITEFSRASGNPEQTGLIYAALGLGSAFTALGAVALPKKFTQAQRILVGGLGIASGALACSFANSPLTLTLLLFIMGMAIGPTSVAIFTLTGELAPTGNSAIAITAIGSINILCVSLSTTITGILIETNLTYGFYMAITSGILMALSNILIRCRK